MAIQNTNEAFVFPQTAGDTYNGGAADQTYSISPALIGAGDTITIIDQGGNNSIELPAGLEITNSIVVNNEAQLTLSNGAVINIRGADTFTFNIGQNTVGGDTEGSQKNFTEFAQDVLGVTVPAAGEAPAEGGSSTINDDGTSTVDPTPTPTDPTMAVTADADNVDEGGTVNFTIAAAEGQDALTEGTEVAYTLSGVDAEDIDGDLTGTATIGADGTANVAVALTEDATTEGEETLTMSLDGSDASSVVIVNDTSTAPAVVQGITAASNSVTEGNELTFTVTMDRPVDEDTDVRYQVQGVETSVATAASPVDDIGVLNGNVTIAAGESTGTFTLKPSSDGVTEGFEAFKVVLLDENLEAGEQTNNILIEDPANAGQTFKLTAGVDDGGEFTGGAGNDTYTATGSTFSELDSLDGGAGVDRLNINDADGVMNDVVPNGATLTNMEYMKVSTTGDLGPVSEQRSITVDATPGNYQSKSITVNYGTLSSDITTAADADRDDVADQIMNAINSLAGDEVASDGGTGIVDVESAAGESLPTISLSGDGGVAAIGAKTTEAVGDGYDVSDFALTEFELTKADTAAVTVAETTDAVISGVDNGITLVNGATQTVDLDSGSATLSDSAGAINVTHSNQTAAIDIENGSDVNVDATVSNTTTTPKNGESINVGAEDETATGDVTITKDLTTNGETAMAGGATTVVGGANVDVTINATVNAKDEDSDGDDITIDAVDVTADDNTETVTVTQNATENTFEKDEVLATAGTTEVTFKGMDANETLIVGGLTFKATEEMDAEAVAEAFSNLAQGDTQSEGGPVANGYYTDSLTSDWTTSAAVGAKVVFTNAADVDGDNSAEDAPNTTFTGDAANKPTVVETAGTAYEAEDDSTSTVNYGGVDVDENSATAADKSITTITLDGFDSANLGGNSAAKSLDKLTTLSLSNSDGATKVNTTQTALDLTVDNVRHDVDLDENTNAENITDLNLTVTGDNANDDLNSDIALTAVAVTDLTIDAGANIDITGNAIGSGNTLETVAITGAGKVDLGTNATSTALSSFDASGNTGGITATIDANKATMTEIDEEVGYLFSDGADTVTVNDATLDLKISLAAGDDSITLESGTTELGEMIDGGTGTNTLHMDAADAATASASNVFETNIDNFQKLSLGKAAASTTAAVDMDNLDEINHVITSNTESQTAEQAEFTYDLKDLVLDTDGTVTLGGEVIYTASTDAVDATTIATAIDDANGGDGTTVTIDGTDYTVTSTGGTNLTLTTDNDVVVDTAPTLASTGEKTNGEPNVLTFDIDGIVLDDTGTLSIADGDQGIKATLFSATQDGMTASTIATALNGETVTLGTVDYTISVANNTEITMTATQDAAPQDWNNDTLTLATTGNAVETPAAKHVLEFDLTDAVLDANEHLVLSYNGTSTDLFTAGGDALNAAEIQSGLLANGAIFIDGNPYDVSVAAGNVVTLTSQANITKDWNPSPSVNVSSGTSPDSTTVNETQGVADDVHYSLNSTNVGGVDSGQAATTTDDIDDPAATPVSNGSTGNGALTLENFADEGTVEIVEEGAGLTVEIKDAGDDTVAGYDSNVLNVITGKTTADENLDLGTLTVNEVETVNITTTQNYDANGNSTNNEQTLAVSADEATSITAGGAGHLELSVTAPKLEEIDATGLEGDLDFTASIEDLVVNSGSGDDDLEANAESVQIKAGDGDDLITVTDQAVSAQVWGEEGADIFDFTDAELGDTQYATIMDFEAGDSIKFDADNFISDGVTATDPESTSDWLEAAFETIAEETANWFNHGENTYIVVNKAGANGFEAADDTIIKIAGVHDLSEASFNDNGTLEMA